MILLFLQAKEFKIVPPAAHIEMFAKKVVATPGGDATSPTTPDVNLRKSSRQRTTVTRTADTILSEAPALKAETERIQTLQVGRNLFQLYVIVALYQRGSKIMALL